MALSADVRRVVTTVDKSDKAVVLFDGANPHKKVRPHAQTVSRVIWVTDQAPADITGTADRGAVEIGIQPPRNGIGIPHRRVPAGDRRDAQSRSQHHASRASATARPSADCRRGIPAMHRTRTIDYAVVMAGEIDMLLDDSEIHLKAGDVLVQQGTNHAWVNRGTEPCRIAFVLIDSKEP